jgi:hypothetical protein
MSIVVDSQDGHAESKPEILLTNDADTVRVPCVPLEVVTVAENDEDPCGGETKPSNETMVTFEDAIRPDEHLVIANCRTCSLVMCVAHPRECTPN